MNPKIAMVQSETFFGENEAEINMGRAEKYIDEAADQGANIICFPESFPGPWKQPIAYSPKERMARKAAERKVYVIFGDLEEVGEKNGDCYNVLWFVGPDGKVIGKYRRTTPLGPWVYKGGNHWDFNYVTGDELQVFDTEFGKVGILMCSEAYSPELSRILTLKGAEIIFLPAGTPGYNWHETWGTLIKARAYENLAYTGVCRNMFGSEATDGLCIIAGPEGPLLEAHTCGVFTATLDMDRLRFLRASKDGPNPPVPWKVKPGQPHQWRRPELCEELTKIR